MAKRKVIKATNFPSAPSRALEGGAVIYLLLDKFNAPVWLISVLMTIFALGFIALIVGAFTEERCEVLFKED